MFARGRGFCEGEAATSRRGKRVEPEGNRREMLPMYTVYNSVGMDHGGVGSELCQLSRDERLVRTNFG